MVVASSEEDVANTVCSFAMELRDEFENGKLTLSKSKSKIIGNRNGLTKRPQRALKVNDFHLSVQCCSQHEIWASMRLVEAEDDVTSETKDFAQQYVGEGERGGTEKPSGTTAKLRQPNMPLHFLLVVLFLGRERESSIGDGQELHRQHFHRHPNCLAM